MFIFKNNGAKIVETNYWASEHAKKGFIYLSSNAGIWRLLIPSSVHSYVEEIRTATRVEIESSQIHPEAWDIVFEDGTDRPFVITLDKRQVDRAMTPGDTRLTVWTEAGEQADLPCTVIQ